jgi:hypothetical protein
MSDKKKLTAEELAASLEEQAKLIREKGLTDEELDKIAGGGDECCGSNCNAASWICVDGYLFGICGRA